MQTIQTEIVSTQTTPPIMNYDGKSITVEVNQKEYTKVIPTKADDTFYCGIKYTE